MKTTTSLAAVLLFYFVLSLMLRGWGIYSNVLYADDYLFFVSLKSTIISYDICRFPAQDYRWLFIGNICFSGKYFDSLVLSFYPKVLANLFVSLFSFSTFLIFRQWGLANWLSILLPAVLLVHPIINEIVLWNITGPLGLFFAMVCAGYYLLSFSNKNEMRALGFILLAGVAISYEYSLVIFILLVFAEPITRYSLYQSYSVRKTVYLIFIFVIVSLLYISQNILSTWLFPDPLSFRGISENGILLSSMEGFLIKVRALSNLVVNVYMTPLSFYIQLEKSWALWKWIPIAIVVFTFISALVNKRTFLAAFVLSSFSLCILILALTPLMLSSQSPESWRVSIPCGLAMIMGLIPLITNLDNLLSKSKKLIHCPKIFLVFLIAILAYPSYSETNLRVYENSLESELLQEVGDFWVSKGVSLEDVRVGRLLQGMYSKDLKGRHPADRLSIAFHRRGLQLNLKDTISWRGRILKAGLAVVEIEFENTEFVRSSSSECKQEGICRYELESYFVERCENSPSYVQSDTGIRLSHMENENISVICI